MAIEYLGLSEINGPLVVLEGVKNASYEEIVEFHMDDGTRKIGRIIEIYEDKAVIQVFEGTDGMSLGNTHTRLTGRPMEIGLSPEILGRTFNGIGQPIDGLGDITPDVKLNINGLPLNRAIYTEDGDMQDIYAGDFLVVGLTEDDFGSLTSEQMQKFEEQFYNAKGLKNVEEGKTAPMPKFETSVEFLDPMAEVQDPPVEEEENSDDNSVEENASLIAKLLSNPEAAALLKALAKTI